MAYDLNSAFAVSALNHRLSEVGKKRLENAQAEVLHLSLWFDYALWLFAFLIKLDLLFMWVLFDYPSFLISIFT